MYSKRSSGRRPIKVSRDGGLRAQIGSGVGQPPAGELERRVAAQSVEIVGIFIAAGDRENPGAQNIRQPMGDAARIALVRDHPGEPLGNAEPVLRLGKQHDATIRAEASAIKGGGDFLTLYGWK